MSQFSPLRKQFYITEVFSEQPYGGNQLATVLDAADIDTPRMQQIARAFNFSETTFFVGGSLADGFDVRIFTPSSELPFAGHPTLGSAYLARHIYGNDEVDSLVLNLGVGPIPVTFGADGVAWMRQNPPTFGGTVEVDVVAAHLGLEVDDIDTRAPCQYVSTGLEFLIVPVVSMTALKKIRVGGDDLGHGILVFCEEGYEPGQTLAARMFASSMGVSEDPATGSAGGCLASYLVQHAWLGGHEIDIRIAQGYEIARPSQLYLRASRIAGKFEINVGGRVGIAASGEWEV